MSTFKFRLFSSASVLLWTLLFSHPVPNEGANILFFFPAGSFSHKQSIWPAVTALADAGHNVTFLSGYDKKPSENSKVHDLKSITCEKLMKSYYGRDRLEDRQQGLHLKMWDAYHHGVLEVCELILSTKVKENDDEDPFLRYVLYEAQYDLVINNLVFGECGLLVAHQKKAKLITSVSTPWYTYLYDELGFPAESSWIPEMSKQYHFPMGLLNRIENYITPIRWYFSRKWELYPALEGIMKKAYSLKEEEVPSLAEVQQNTSMVFTLAHFSTDFPRALPPMVVNIGGMQCWMPSKPLDGEFKEILDKATGGAILIAFGSTINLATMPQRFKDMFLGMMTHFPDVTFIWRWDGPLPSNPPKNLIVAKWLPQFQILSHPNLKGFISHAGLNSLTEATFHGVPVILIPLFADQDYNGYRIEATEIGMRLEVVELSTELMVHSVKEVLTNPKYSKNMKAMSALMRDRPHTPIESAVYWTEFVLRHEDTSSLKPFRNQSWFVRRQLDVLVLLILASLIILFAVSYICIYLLRKIVRKSIIGCEPRTKSKTN